MKHVPAFPKPGQIKTVIAAIKIFRDGREVCNLKTKAGNEEYHRRKWEMWTRQKGICCLCGKPLLRSETTFEHENGRGAGKQDDRIVIIVDGKEKWQNGAAHGLCNVQKGSRRIAYNDALQVFSCG